MDIRYTLPVETTGGKIRGYYQEDGIRVFKGVPYAEPPTGERRWKPAERYARREGVRDCLEFGHCAWQNPIDDYSKMIWTTEFLVSKRDYSEDCLTLNMWAAEGRPGMPVILYLYGGGFVSGGSSCEIYDGTTLAKNGVIYITFNHREGVFAWHANSDLRRENGRGIAGNYMLSDTVAVLEWIRDNISRFGGDPHNVTIWGQSAGASEVNLLSVSPVARDLFQRTLSMGFNSYFVREWKTLDEICETGDALEKEFGGSLEAMRSTPPENFLPYFSGSIPAIDGYYADGQFDDCVKKGYGSDKPFMLGSVAEDGMVMPVCRMIRRCAGIDEYRTILKQFFPDTAELIEERYLTDGIKCSETAKEMGHDLLLKTMLDFARARKKADPESVTYLYIFKHVMPGPMSATFGAFHSFEVPYFTNHFSDLRKDYWTQTDRDLGVKTNAELVSYAKTGRPASADFTESDGYSVYVIDTDRQYKEIITEARYRELERLFGKG